MSDEVNGALLERFVQGDQDAFESLFRQFEREVFGWIVRIVRDPTAAEDVLVETFWRAYRGRARFDSSRSFGAWIRRIATNAALDQLAVARTPSGVVTTYHRHSRRMLPVTCESRCRWHFESCRPSCRSWRHSR